MILYTVRTSSDSCEGNYVRINVLRNCLSIHRSTGMVITFNIDVTVKHLENLQRCIDNDFLVRDSADKMYALCRINNIMHNARIKCIVRCEGHTRVS